MRLIYTLLLAIGVTMHASCFAEDPQFALSHFRADGPKGTVRGATIAALTLKTHDFCRGTLQSFRENVAKQPGVVVENQACLSKLPAELMPVLQGKALPNAAYVKYTDSKFFVKVIAWDLMFVEGLQNPSGYCDRTIERYRQLYKKAECKPAMP